MNTHAVLVAALLAIAPTSAAADGEGDSGNQPPAPNTSSEAASAPRMVDYRSGGPVGLGLTLGHRSGLSVQAWPTPDHAFSFDVGATPFVNTLAIAAGWTGRPAHIQAPGGVSAHVYLGVGVRLRMAFQTAVGPGGDPVPDIVPLLGVRVPIGISFLLRGFPVEFFAEVAPAVDAWSAFGVDVEGIGGVRVYLGSPTPRRRSQSLPPEPEAAPRGAPTRTVAARPLPAPAPIARPLVPGKPGVPIVGFTVSIGGSEAATVQHRKEKVTIGKGADVVLRLDDAALADLQCSVQLLNGGLVLVDLAGGTKLNGSVVSSAPLKGGDRIEAGETVITLTITPTDR